MVLLTLTGVTHAGAEDIFCSFFLHLVGKPPITNFGPNLCIDIARIVTCTLRVVCKVEKNVSLDVGTSIMKVVQSMVVAHVGKSAGEGIHGEPKQGSIVNL